MVKKLFSWIHKYERHLSAAAMVGGFILDNIYFSRPDLVRTHLLLIAYLVIAAVSICWLHYLEERTADGARRSRWRSVLPIVTQFMFGGLWSAFVIFYTRSATISASWPFLLLLGAIFIGNELFKQYHDRLVFNAVLYFFALFSYAIFAVPIVTHTIGPETFILSGIVAIVIFALFMVALRKLGRFRFLGDIWRIRFFSGVVFFLLNIFYFTNVLPPLPLALSAAGIYHDLARAPAGGYVAQKEQEPWYDFFGVDPVIHVAPGEPLYAYTAVFAPIDLSANVAHVWEWHNPATGQWEKRAVVSFAISGGRVSGYRGYSKEADLAPGSWRVEIETADGRLLGRLGFTLVAGSATTTSVAL